MAALQVDIGILTIRDDEFRAVLAVFPEVVASGIHNGKNRDYALRYADAGNGAKYRVGIVRQPEQGNGEAQEAARDILEDLKPRLVLVVGIAGGLPSDELTLGDVVLSTRIHDFTVEARKAYGKTTYAISGGPMARRVATSIANLAARERDLGPWKDGLPHKPNVIWNHAGQLYGPKQWQRELREKLEGHHGRSAIARRPLFEIGPIASSDRLVKDPRVLFPWIDTARNLLAVEMESGGVYRATRERCAMLAIRALSDIVGLKRSNAWTKYACASAAAFACGYLKTRPIEPRGGIRSLGQPSAASRAQSRDAAKVSRRSVRSALDVTAAWLLADQYPYGEWGRSEDKDARTRTLAISRVKPNFFVSCTAAYALVSTGRGQAAVDCFLQWMRDIRRDDGWWTSASGARVPFGPDRGHGEVANIRHTAKGLDILMLRREFAADDVAVFRQVIDSQMSAGAYAQHLGASEPDVWTTAYVMNLLIRSLEPATLRLTRPRAISESAWSEKLRAALQRSRDWLCSQIALGKPEGKMKAVAVEIGADLALHRTDTCRQLVDRIFADDRVDAVGAWGLLLMWDTLRREERSRLLKSAKALTETSYRDFSAFDAACHLRILAIVKYFPVITQLVRAAKGHESLLLSWNAWTINAHEAASKPKRRGR